MYHIMGRLPDDVNKFWAENMKLNILAALATIDALKGGHVPAHQVHLHIPDICHFYHRQVI